MTKKERIGIVVSCKTFKTRVIAIQIRYRHEKYAKTLVKTKRYMIHDEKESSKLGDIVSMEECAPISRKKKWALKQILKSYII